GWDLPHVHEEDVCVMRAALFAMRKDILPEPCRAQDCHDTAGRAPDAPLRIVQKSSAAMTRYVLCRNLECGCPIPESQDFCDNCNSPSSTFLKSGPAFTEGSLLGYTQDGSE